jgi:rhodanese-related sulfurtransferase
MDPNAVTVPEPSRISVDEALAMLNRGEPVTFVDARNPVAWGKAETKLPEAVRVPADDVLDQLARIPRGRAIITYCT